MNENNDKEISSLDEFFDDDPTDEFPALNLRDIDPQLAEQFDDSPIDDTGQLPIADQAHIDIPASDAESPRIIEHSNPSLRQMELEIQALQTKWHTIENDVRSRDEVIEILEAELITQKSAADELQAELDESKTQLTKVNDECARLETENSEQIITNDQQQTRIESAEADLVEQDSTIDELRKTLDDSRQELAEAVDASENLAAESLQQEQNADALSKRLTTAEDELIKQTASAKAMQSDLEQSRASLDTLAENSEKLSTENQAHQRAATKHADQVSVLQAANLQNRTKLDDLTNYIAGRKTDWRELNAEAAQQREINVGLQQAITAKIDALTLKKQENSALLGAMKIKEREAERLRSALSENEDTVAEEQAARRELRQRLAEKTEYTEALETANAEFMEVASSQHTLKDQLEAKNRDIDRLNQALTQLDAEHAETATALKKQQEVIQHMENEVRSKLEAITVIGRKAQRKTSKPASIHQLDVSRSRNPARRHAKRFMVALNGQQDNEFQIEQGTITIGRSPGNDICLKHHFISRTHAKILTDAKGSVIEDLGSKNGILVNTEPVNRKRLSDGDLVDIGEMQFKFIDPMAHSGDHDAH